MALDSAERIPARFITKFKITSPNMNLPHILANKCDHLPLSSRRGGWGVRLLFSLLLLSSCSSDLGNYTYHAIEEVAVRIDTAYTGIVGERLHITPTLTADGFKAENYDFEWRAINQIADTATVIGTEQDLDYTVRLAPGDYTLVCTVQKKEAETFDRTTAALSVRTPYSEGWLVLSSDNGRARLDMHSFVKDTTYTDILSGTTPATWCTPYAVRCLPNANYPEAPFYLLTADGTTRLADQDFAWKDEYLIRYEMGNASDTDVRPTAIAENGVAKLLIAGGKPYYCDNSTGDGLFMSARKNTFDVDSRVGFDALTDHMAPVFLMWDTKNRRFVVCATMLASADILGTTVSSDVALSTLGSFYKFPVGQESAFTLPANGRYDLVHLENTRYDPLGIEQGTTYTILSRGTERHVYGFALGDLVSIRYEKYGNAYTKVIHRNISSLPGITEATHFAFSSLKNYFYYVSGGTVWRADMTQETPTAVRQFDLPEGETLTLFKHCMPTQSTNARQAYSLLVGTKDAEGHGTLRIYDEWATEGDLTDAAPAYTYTGFAEIADVLLREIIGEY